MEARLTVKKTEITLKITSGKIKKTIKLNPVQLLDLIKNFKRDFRHEHRNERSFYTENFFTRDYLEKLKK